jgi:hypothetical protein
VPHSLEYHICMRPSNSAPVALLAVLATSLFLISAQAQINGTPASVTSPGFGGRPVNGPPASVTSLGPRGFTPGPRATFTAPVPNGVHGDGHHHHHRNSEFTTPFLYAVPVPYAVDANAFEDDAQANEDDAEYQGGPTVFDRRGAGQRSYVPPMKDAAPHAAQPASETPDDPPADPEPPLPPTLLVFKDGHKLEVGNYAIVGTTLFDLTPGHSRRVALADLDLDATAKQNDERGIIFQIPQAPKAN